MFPVRFLSVLCLALTLPLAARAEGRFALVIGTGDYDHIADLANPGRDADAIADLLKSLGFDVTEESDRDTEDLRDALADFAEDAAGADLALVFYAGHGVEIAGENRLLPTDAAASGLDALAPPPPLTEVAQTLATLAPAAILLVDACRNDPFAGTPLAAASRAATALDPDPARPIAPGFARVGPAQGLVYAFSTAPGDVASDGPEGAHSPFTAALLRHLGTPGLNCAPSSPSPPRMSTTAPAAPRRPISKAACPTSSSPPASRPTSPNATRSSSPWPISPPTCAPRSRTSPPRATCRWRRSTPPSSRPISPPPRPRNAAPPCRKPPPPMPISRPASRSSPLGPRVAEIRAAAAAEMDLGATRSAFQQYDKAAEIDAAAAAASEQVFVTRTLSQAETLLLKADAARAALDHETALAAFAEAEALFARVEPLGIPRAAMEARTLALWDAGDLQLLLGNTQAALALYRDWAAVAGARVDATPDDMGLCAISPPPRASSAMSSSRRATCPGQRPNTRPP